MNNIFSKTKPSRPKETTVSKAIKQFLSRSSSKEEENKKQCNNVLENHELKVR
jgi:hypothetical protein